MKVAADGITAISGRALRHVALVAHEQQLALTTPAASGRLAAIAAAHARAMTGIVMEAARVLAGWCSGHEHDRCRGHRSPGHAAVAHVRGRCPRNIKEPVDRESFGAALPDG